MSFHLRYPTTKNKKMRCKYEGKVLEKEKKKAVLKEMAPYQVRLSSGVP